MVQTPARTHDYSGGTYLTPERLAAYYYQFSEIAACRPCTCLEIGMGPGVLSHLLRRANVRVTSMDLDTLARPDVFGTVTGMPFKENSFEMVACFQVLEHLRWKQFPIALADIHRVSSRYVILSLPDVQRYVKLDLHIPKLGRRRLFLQLPNLFAARFFYDGEHYWQIGNKGHFLSRIFGIISDTGFTVLKHFRAWEHPYHHFFVLQKRGQDGN